MCELCDAINSTVKDDPRRAAALLLAKLLRDAIEKYQEQQQRLIEGDVILRSMSEADRNSAAFMAGYEHGIAFGVRAPELSNHMLQVMDVVLADRGGFTAEQNESERIERHERMANMLAEIGVELK